MKAFAEIILIWGIVLALVLAAFLLNFWLVHSIEVFIGTNATWCTIGVSVLIATCWIFGTGKKA